MRVIRDKGRRTAVHVPIEVRRHGLRREVGLTRPEIHLPGDTTNASEAHGERATEDAAGDDATDLASWADAIVVSSIEAEPSVDAERDTGLLHDLTERKPFADRTGHRLLAPNGLTEASSRGRDDAMPVRWGADVDDVGIGEADDLTEVARALRGSAPSGYHLFNAVVGMVIIHVADREDAVRALHVVAEVGARTGDATATDDDVVKRLAGGDETAAQNVARNDGKASGCNGSLLEEGTTG